MERGRNVIKYLKVGRFLYLPHRSCASDSFFSENEETELESKKKVKLSVTKKIIPLDSSCEHVIIQSREASEVMKNLNWQFKLLYGAVQKPKKEKYILNGKKKSYGEEEIIQTQSLIPISEPEHEFELCSETDSEVSQSRSEEVSYLNSILKFPLINDESHISKCPELQVNEMNSMRKELESRSESYVPSVTRILDKTMSLENAERLRLWKERMIEKLGEEGFKMYHSEILSNGHKLHECINNYLISASTSKLEIDESIEGHWNSLKPIFQSIDDVKLIEEKLSHPFLRYKGIVDCFARYKGNLVVIDWKTSKRKKHTITSTFDNPLQIAAYVGALNFDPKYQYLVKKGLIIIAYEDGTPASAHLMREDTMLRYWKEWLKRLKMYWESIEET